MHTTNLYPTPDHLVRLDSIKELMINFPKHVIGLSDHTKSNHSSFGAVALGASLIERHFVDKKIRVGPDVSSSNDEIELKKLIEGVNIIFLQRGGNKSSLKEEQVTRNFAFASVVATENIKKGDKLTKKNLWIKRPGTGYFNAEKFKKLLGKKAKKNIKKNFQLKKDDIS